MIQLNGIRYSIADRILFDEVDWMIGPGDRCALVGPNGAGKTTLLRIMLGELAPDAGTRVLARGARVGYLPQESAERWDGTVLERAMEAFRSLLAMREELDALHQDLQGIAADDPRLEALLERAGELQHRLEARDEHALEPEARRVLSGLGFSRADQDRPLAEFSGGWRMRAALAALLLTDPTLLFLDEPTNHLDLPAMEWLEEYLTEFGGGLVVVSHDRVFLDRIADEIAELDHATLTHYPMTFTKYLAERETRREQMESKNQQLDQRIAQLARFVERFGAKNTKAAQAQSKRRMIERLAAQRVVLPRPPRSIRFTFPPPPHSGRLLVQLREVAFGYDARDVFANARVEIAPGDKVAIVGANGAGKTTLLRVLAGQLEPRSGEREVWPHTKSAWFAQHAAETLEPGATVLEALEETAPPVWRPKLRSLLGSFLFHGDDVFKKCRVLSGGERQRVALARILLLPANLLLLDEPTHHLDLAGKEVLEEALNQYPGAVVVVTHDRSLMARLATRVFEVSEGRVVPYPGGYDDYEAARLSAASRDGGEDERGGSARGSVAVPGRRATPPAGPDGRPQRQAPGGNERRDKRATGGPAQAAGGRGSRVASDAVPSAASATPKAREDREARGARQKREKELARVEKDLAAREGEMKEVEALLADPEVYADGGRARELVGRYERLRIEVESLWQKLAEL